MQTILIIFIFSLSFMVIFLGFLLTRERLQNKNLAEEFIEAKGHLRSMEKTIHKLNNQVYQCPMILDLPAVELRDYQNELKESKCLKVFFEDFAHGSFNNKTEMQ